jgi:CRISPR-associated endonuclease Cas1
MRSQPIAPLPVSRSGVCAVDGYGVKIRVERGRLLVSDSIGPLRREARLARATHGVRRLVVLGHSGFISLDGIRWLADVGIGFVQLDPDGRLLIASGGMGLDDPRLRRAQAMAFGQPSGMAVARALLDAKLAGQLRVASSLSVSKGLREAIERAAALLRLATTPAELMVPEAAAASAYWSAWSGIELRWAKADGSRIPDLWRTVGNRASPLTGNPRLAASPAMAMLNYMYALLEAEARLACLAMGLDPGLGVLHADQRARDSLALDVMEAVRPDVDALLLDLINRRTFRRADFLETREGGCRIVAPLTHELAETTTIWRSRLGPVVERVATMLMAEPRSVGNRLPTRLTGTARQVGRNGIRRHPRPATRVPSFVRANCRDCGGPTPSVERDLCDTCLPAFSAERSQRAIVLARTEKVRLAAAGADPAQATEAAAKRRATQVRHSVARREWERRNGRTVDLERYRRDIAPIVVQLGPTELRRLTGYSYGHCLDIVRGERVLHPLHWDTLTRATIAGIVTT